MLVGKTNEEKIWNYFKAKGLNNFGCAGLVGNLYAESGLHPNNLQNTGNVKLGMTDDEYVAAIDNGTYTKNQFIYDNQGAFIAQWTHWSRKKELYEFWQSRGGSIGDLEMQLDFLYKELSEKYKSVLNTLKTAKSVLEASNAVLLNFECPAGMDDPKVQNKRAEYGQQYYNKYANSKTEIETKPNNKPSGGGVTMKYDKQKVIDIALAEVGYLEKASNSQLDDKTANAGYNNWNKYARDIDEKYPNFYNGKKNGYAWCDVFADWCFIKAYGEAAARELLCAPQKSYGAGCQSSANYYRNKGQFYRTNPQLGDQIFFGTYGNEQHTGIVYAVDSSKVYTVEGNTSGAAGVVANGGGVFKKSYALGSSSISGYGRPNYENGSISSVNNSTSTTSVTSMVSSIKAFQTWLNINYKTSISVDGEYGPLTKKAAIKAFQSYANATYQAGLVVDGEFGPLSKAAARKCLISKGMKGAGVYIVQGLLYCNNINAGGFDGEFGSGMDNAVKSYQTKKSLTIDGIVGANTWNAFLG